MAESTLDCLRLSKLLVCSAVIITLPDCCLCEESRDTDRIRGRGGRDADSTDYHRHRSIIPSVVFT